MAATSEASKEPTLIAKRSRGNAGAGEKTWRAYFSVTDLNGKGAINARDRIGRGPWHNANGVRIAIDVEDLHSDSANITADTAHHRERRQAAGRAEPA